MGYINDEYDISIHSIWKNRSIILCIVNSNFIQYRIIIFGGGFYSASVFFTGSIIGGD